MMEDQDDDRKLGERGSSKTNKTTFSETPTSNYIQSQTSKNFGLLLHLVYLAAEILNLPVKNN